MFSNWLLSAQSFQDLFVWCIPVVHGQVAGPGGAHTLCKEPTLSASLIIIHLASREGGAEAQSWGRSWAAGGRVPCEKPLRELLWGLL